LKERCSNLNPVMLLNKCGRLLKIKKEMQKTRIKIRKDIVMGHNAM
jgi:hypothetical protein